MLTVMNPRKLIGLVISLALIAAGVVMCIVPFIPGTDMHLNQIVFVGPMLLAAGGFWIYEDWLVQNDQSKQNPIQKVSFSADYPREPTLPEVLKELSQKMDSLELQIWDLRDYLKPTLMLIGMGMLALLYKLFIS